MVKHHPFLKQCFPRFELESAYHTDYDYLITILTFKNDLQETTSLIQILQGLTREVLFGVHVWHMIAVTKIFHLARKCVLVCVYAGRGRGRERRKGKEGEREGERGRKERGEAGREEGEGGRREEKVRRGSVRGKW